MLSRLAVRCRPVLAGAAARPLLVSLSPSLLAPPARALWTAPLGVALLRPDFQIRALAKKGKGKKAKAAAAAEEDEDAVVVDPSEALDEPAMQAEFAAALESLHSHLASLRSGRVDPGLLSNVRVQAYGEVVTIPEVAQVAAKDGRLLTVTCFDPSLTQAACDAVRNAGMGLSPSTTGSVVHVPIPKMTAERRKEFSKAAHHNGELTKERVRKVRHKYRDIVKKSVAEADFEKRLEKTVQDATDAATKQIEETVAAKVAEIMASEDD